MRSLIVLAVACGVSACAHAPPGGLTPGRLVAGELAQTDEEFSDGSHYRMYPFQGRAGDTITARLSSDDFDANLILTDAHGNRLADDDDGGGACNARLTITYTASGTYQLLVNTVEPRATGPFLLTVRLGTAAPPAGLPRCSGESP